MSTTIESSCHCGAVRLHINDEPPAALTSCNCSICTKYGGLFAYYSASKVTVVVAPGSTHEYVWGDKQLAFVRCSQCGCLSHWRGIDPNSTSDRMGINARLFTNVEIGKIRIRRFDGADTWKFLD
jgi:hypothetical protein